MNNNTFNNMEIIKDGKGFTLNFKVMYKQHKPVIKFAKVPEARYNMPSWNTSDMVNKKDDFLPHEWETESSNANDFSFDYFKAGEIIDVNFESANIDGELNICENDKFALEVVVNALESGEYVISYNFSPKVNGWFSIGYTGAPQESFDSVEAIWQPMVWLDKCFPVESYLTTEFNCPVPTTLVSLAGITYGVVVEPSEMHFRMPTAKNSRFGVMVKNTDKKAQPIVFTPVLGGEESYMEVGTRFCFKIRLIAKKLNWVDTFEYIAREIYGFTDMRKNVTCSLTETMYNMIDYAMNDYYSKWDAALKGCSYQTDVPGSVKNVSALHMLGISYIMDNKEILEQRVLPTVEYLMSRQKLLFAMSEEVKGQGASHYLDGPCIAVSELSSLYNMFKGKTSVFKQEAMKQYNEVATQTSFNMVGKSAKKGKTWGNGLAVYRMTRDKNHLEEAKKLALEYLSTESDAIVNKIKEESFFWPDYIPEWAEFTELYEETGESIFLDAAYKRAKKFCSFIWYCPKVPNSNVLVNKDGKASKYWYSRGPEPMNVPEEEVEAWRVSEIGLTCEASGTGHGHRGIFMTFHAPYLLRLAKYTGDKFLHDTARAAIIGRYTNFPGYHMNTERCTVYEKFDYPYHEFEELTYNTFHYNHIWPHISMVMDYLITDVFYKSQGQINFPSQYAECYAYMQSRIYGDRPGCIYDEKNVWIWMPKGVLKTGSEQLNFVTARGNGKLYAIFTNQSDNEITTNVYLNSDVVPFDKAGTNSVRVWMENKEAALLTMKCGVLPIQIAAKGITVIAIDAIEIKTGLDGNCFLTPDLYNEEKNYNQVNTEFGKITSMLIRFGENYINNLFVWLTATEKVLSEVSIHYVLDGKEYKETDKAYPFEFTIPLGSNKEIEFWIEATRVDGSTEVSEKMVIKA